MYRLERLVELDLGVLTGLTPPSALVAWADEEIMHLEAPATELFDISLGARLPKYELERLIAPSSSRRACRDSEGPRSSRGTTFLSCTGSKRHSTRCTGRVGGGGSAGRHLRRRRSWPRSSNASRAASGGAAAWMLHGRAHRPPRNCFLLTR